MKKIIQTIKFKLCGKKKLTKCMDVEKSKSIKDKIILVSYIGVGNLDETEVPDFLNQVADEMTPKDDDSVVCYFIPTRDIECRLECINPVLVSEEKYVEVEKKLSELHEKMTEAIENFSK